MIMHISQEFDDSQNEEFGRINQKYAEGFIDDSILSHDVSDVKVEPIEFDLSSGSSLTIIGSKSNKALS
jgi:hypothetical protein